MAPRCQEAGTRTEPSREREREREGHTHKHTLRDGSKKTPSHRNLRASVEGREREREREEWKRNGRGETGERKQR